MVRVILSGCNGKMGQVITRAIADMAGIEIAAGLDVKDDIRNPYPVFTDPACCDITADVVIDFSHFSYIPTVLQFALARRLPIVVATTGVNEQIKAQIEQAAHSIPVFLSANMSLGINLLLELVKKATEVLQGQFDIEILEKHHNRKIDAPSGTAIMIADAVAQAADFQPDYIYDRHSRVKKREKTEIGISSLRGGTIVGEHEVLFAGNDELIEIKHTALSREVFATGAISAAKYLVTLGGKPGIYHMQDMIGD